MIGPADRSTAAASDVLASFRLDGKVAMVTGAGRGLGRAMALTLGHAGARLGLMDVNPVDLDGTSEVMRQQGMDVITGEVDVADGDQVRDFVARVVEDWGGVHVLVNNAGVTSRSPFEDLDEAGWDRVMRVNLRGIFLCSKWAAREMMKQGGGSIINVASISGLVGNRGGDNSHYCASKGGVIALTRSLAVEWASRGIRVNAVAPGYFVTPMTDRLKSLDPAFYQELVGRIPLGRFGRDEDLAGPILFLASDASSFVSGHVLVVDGAYTAW